MMLSARDCAEIREVIQGKATGRRYSEVAAWLASADFRTPAKSDGSHRTWRHSSGARVVLVDKGRGELLPPYVKNAIRKILETGACPE